MSGNRHFPRSILHALEPQGLDTGQTESLLSYFCRLAVSHAVSTTDLARFVISQAEHALTAEFQWQRRNLSGVGEAAHTWSAWLSALTGVGELDVLTLSRWSGVLPTLGLSPRHAHWCPQCLREDRESGRPPYFRLAWEVGSVSVCERHQVALVDCCPHCGQRHVRHQSEVVVPGWCTRCGGFLGEAKTAPAEAAELWVARQVGDWLAKQADQNAMPKPQTVLATLDTLILGLDGGQYSRFAKRIGVSKNTVHGWLRLGVLPRLDAYLAMALHSGLSLDEVIRGKVTDWTPRTPGQLAMAFELIQREKKAAPREHDWSAIRSALAELLQRPEPISVAEACRRLEVDERRVYLQANTLARAVAARWKQHQAGVKGARQSEVKGHLREAYRVLRREGRPFNLTEIRQVADPGVLGSVEGVFELIREVRDG